MLDQNTHHLFQFLLKRQHIHYKIFAQYLRKEKDQEVNSVAKRTCEQQHKSNIWKHSQKLYNMIYCWNCGLLPASLLYIVWQMLSHAISVINLKYPMTWLDVHFGNYSHIILLYETDNIILLYMILLIQAVTLQYMIQSNAVLIKWLFSTMLCAFWSSTSDFNMLLISLVFWKGPAGFALVFANLGRFILPCLLLNTVRWYTFQVHDTRRWSSMFLQAYLDTILSFSPEAAPWSYTTFSTAKGLWW